MFTTLYDEYIYRSKLSEQKKSQLCILFLPLKRGRNQNVVFQMSTLMLNCTFSVFLNVRLFEFFVTDYTLTVSRMVDLLCLKKLKNALLRRFRLHFFTWLAFSGWTFWCRECFQTWILPCGRLYSDIFLTMSFVMKSLNYDIIRVLVRVKLLNRTLIIQLMLIRHNSCDVLRIWSGYKDDTKKRRSRSKNYNCDAFFILVAVQVFHSYSSRWQKFYLIVPGTLRVSTFFRYFWQNFTPPSCLFCVSWQNSVKIDGQCHVLPRQVKVDVVYNLVRVKFTSN